MEKFTTLKKQSMSYYDLLAWIIENSDLLKGCRIDNIFKVEGLEAYIFKLFCKGEERNLIMEPARAIYFTKYERSKELTTKLQLLRQLLRGLAITDIWIIERERILRLLLSDSKSIILELLPRGVLIVTDSNNKIIFASETRKMKDRTLIPGINYVLPAKVSVVNEKELDKLIRKKAYARILKVPQELINYLKIEINDRSYIPKAHEIIDKFESELLATKKIEPCYVPEEGFAPYLYSDKCIKTKTFNEAIDEYFNALEKKMQEEEVTKKTEEEKSKIESSLKKLEEDINKFKAEEESLRKIANYILINSVKLEEDINKYKMGLLSFKRTVNGNLIIPSEIGEIEINPKISMPKNAERYFNLSKEIKQKIKKAEEAREELLKKLKEIEKTIEDKKASLSYFSRERDWYEKFRWTYTRNGYLIIGGKDASQNESLVKKYLREQDIFLHADIQGGSIVILRNDSGTEVKEEDIIDAAVLAACYSRAWKSGMGSIDVYWVKGDQVSKSAPSGEYLKKGSFMIYGKKNYIKNLALKLSLGLQKTNNSLRIMVGSEDVITKNSLAYAVIVPGDEKNEEIAKKIANFFIDNLKIQGKDVLIQEIMKALPGNSRIIKLTVVSNNFINQSTE